MYKSQFGIFSCVLRGLSYYQCPTGSAKRQTVSTYHSAMYTCFHIIIIPTTVFVCLLALTDAAVLGENVEMTSRKERQIFFIVLAVLQRIFLTCYFDLSRESKEGREGRKIGTQYARN